ncbi:MAG: hypothetical protein HC843_08100 [Sphingomonadales bacterium]|nr:hypothetical protein [Sphingomonadales bacterium]
MGKKKSDSNSVNVQVGHAENSLFNTAVTQNIGGVHLNLGEDAEEDEAPELPPPNSQSLALFRALSARFTLEELETACWELGIVFEDLPAKTLSGKARQLVQKAEDLSLADKLIALVKRERPDAAL